MKQLKLHIEQEWERISLSKRQQLLSEDPKHLKKVM